MSIKVMKFVDHWVGVPICYGLALINVLLRPILGRAKNVKRIRVSKFFGAGSIILSFPLLESLRATYPDAQITYLTFRSNLGILDLLKFPINVEYIDDRNLGSFLLTTIKVIAKRLSSPCDMAIDLEFYSKYASIINFFSFAKTKIGFYYPALWRKLLYDAPVYFNFSKHILDIYEMVAKQSGVEYYSKSFPPIEIPSSASESVRRYLQSIKHGRWLVGINVNASDLCHGRRWPQDKFAKLIDLLGEAGEYTILLIGSQSEKSYVKDCYEMIRPELRRNVFDVSGNFTMLEFLALLKALDLFITNDSGPVHMAFLLGTPSISIWGPGDPKMYGPLGNNHAYVYRDYPCSPCMYIYRTDPGKFCDYRFPCMSEIQVSDVLKEIPVILNREIKVGL